MSWRFDAPCETGALYGRGAIAGSVLLALGFVGLLELYSQDTLVLDHDYLPYFIFRAVRFVLIGLPAILLCLALYYAGRWQYRQHHPPIPVKTRLKNLTAPSADGLARFDFGWAVGVILKLTYGLLVLVSIAAVTTGYSEISTLFTIQKDVLAFRTLVCILAPFLIVRLISWLSLPRKRETLLLGFRTTFQVMSGYLMATSVIYALVVFITLGINSNFLHKFEKDIEAGELKITRRVMVSNSR